MHRFLSAPARTSHKLFTHIPARTPTHFFLKKIQKKFFNLKNWKNMLKKFFWDFFFKSDLRKHPHAHFWKFSHTYLHKNGRTRTCVHKPARKHTKGLSVFNNVFLVVKKLWFKKYYGTTTPMCILCNEESQFLVNVWGFWGPAPSHKYSWNSEMGTTWINLIGWP